MKKKIVYKILLSAMVTTIFLAGTNSGMETSTDDKIQTLNDNPLDFELQVTEKSHRVYEISIIATNTYNEEITVEYSPLGIMIKDIDDVIVFHRLIVLYLPFKETFQAGEEIELGSKTWRGKTNTDEGLDKYGQGALPEGEYFVDGGFTLGYRFDGVLRHAHIREETIDLPEAKSKAKHVPNMFSRLIERFPILEAILF